MAEKTYFIKGSTLMTIAHTIREYGNFYDNMTIAQMPSYISTNFLSQAVLDALISTPGTSSLASAVLPYEDNGINSKAIYLISESSLLNIANALRAAGGFTDLITPAQISSYIKDKFVPQWFINSLINKTITRIYNSTCETIGAQAFENCVKLSYVEFTKATTVGSSAFKNCVVLDFLSMPKATTIHTDAFSNCKSVSNITLGVASIVGYTGTIGTLTYQNSYLQTLILPDCSLIGEYICSGCYSLSSVSAPNLQTASLQAFRNCSSLTSINLPELTTIGNNAFDGCINLSQVSFPKSSTYGANIFNGVTTLISVTTGGTTIPDWHSYYPDLSYYSNSTATSTASYVFSNCSKVTEKNIYLPKLISVGHSAFISTGITTLNSSIFPELSGSIYDWGFANCASLSTVSLPILKSLGAAVFEYCTQLTKVSLPAVTTLYNNGNSHLPFNGCDNLVEVNMDGLNYIPYDLLRNKKSLQTVYINGATGTNVEAFAGCTSLKSVYMNNMANLSQNKIFQNCTQLSYLSAPNLTSINGEYVFQSTGFTLLQSELFPALTKINNWGFANCDLLSLIELPTVTTLGAEVFLNCKSLTKVSLPAVTTLYSDGNSYLPFNGCDNLESVNMNGLTKIPYELFRGFSKLTSVYANGATTIKSSAFSGCTALNTIEINNVTTIENRAFYSCTALSSIYVPKLATAGAYAFENTYFSQVNSTMFPALTKIKDYAFNNCTKLQEVNHPLVTELGIYPFQVDNSLTKVILPNVTTVNTTYLPFIDCPNLQEVNLDSLRTVYGNLFIGLKSLTSVQMNKATKVQQSAFSGCTALTTVALNNITTVESYAFKECPALTSIYLPNLSTIGEYGFYNTYFSQLNSSMFPVLSGTIGVAAFADCPSLEKVNLPLVTSLGYWAFSNCTNLKEVYLPTVVSMYNNGDSYQPFANCTNLQLISMDSLKTIAYNFIRGFSTLTSVYFNGATKIQQSAFSGCTSLSTLQLNNATTIESYAFKDCPSLTSIYLPKLVSIGNDAFRQINFSQLNSSMLPLLSGKIGDYGVADCSSLKSVNLPLVTQLGYYAFSNCQLLSYVSLPAVTTLYNGGNTHPPFIGCPVKTVNLNSLTKIGYELFRGITTLTNVYIKETTIIAQSAFSGCTSLTTVSAQKVATIESGAFQGCTSLTSLAFPAATTIQPLVFSGCTKLSIIYLLGSSMAALKNSNAFDGTQITSTTGSIFVPGTLLSSYQTASQWSYFASRMYSMSQRFSLFGTTQTLTNDFMTWTEWDELNNYNQAYTYKKPNSSQPLYYQVPKYSKIQHGTSYYWQQVGTMALTRGDIPLQKTSIPGTFRTSSVTAYYENQGYTYRYSYYQFGKATDIIILGQNYNTENAIITSQMPTE